MMCAGQEQAGTTGKRGKREREREREREVDNYNHN